MQFGASRLDLVLLENRVPHGEVLHSDDNAREHHRFRREARGNAIAGRGKASGSAEQPLRSLSSWSSHLLDIDLRGLPGQP
jgi:hypothetical protein